WPMRRHASTADGRRTAWRYRREASPSPQQQKGGHITDLHHEGGSLPTMAHAPTASRHHHPGPASMTATPIRHGQGWARPGHAGMLGTQRIRHGTPL
ncbi:hypothetical protein NPJ88_020610, partial [Halomonas elongata]|uniref:hypothetical protein n=1 Tax=Halomonas elongata TaxID=2746 RepID=UPI00255ADC66